MPHVSVGLPVYNGASLLPDSLACLAGQTIRDIEVILSDNGSTDATPDICAAMARKDSRFRHVRHELNVGAVKNFFFVRDQALANYFLWRAHDDLSAPNYLEALVRVLDQRSGTILAAPDVFRDASPGTTARAFPYRPRDLGTRLQRLYDQMFRNSACWYYGMWRRTDCIAITNRISAAYPDTWGADHLTIFACALHDGIRGTHETTFHQRIIHAARNDVRPEYDEMKDRNARFDAVCHALLDASDLTQAQKAIVRLWIPFYVRRRCHPTRRLLSARWRKHFGRNGK
jgi:glycosyltransferase involved in cell wall biosynthesis